jgi:hypothetical protein
MPQVAIINTEVSSTGKPAGDKLFGDSSDK